MQNSARGCRAVLSLFFVLSLASAWAQQQVAPGVFRTGYMPLMIDESSGVVASRRYPGVLWTHNDGGFQHIFAVTLQGRLLRSFRVPGNLIDWEDMAIDGAGNLYLADTGTNGMARTHVAVHKVREPNPYHRSQDAKIIQTWLLRFPGRRHDSEALFIHGGFGYLVTKTAVNGTVDMYRFALADRRRSIPLQFVSKVPVRSAVTAADISRDGTRLGLTSPDGVYLFFVRGQPRTAGTAESVFILYHNRLMEGGTFFGKDFVTTSENQRAIFRFTDFCQTAPVFNTPLLNQSVLAGADVRFESSAVGCPSPKFTWRFNGGVVFGNTTPILELTNVSSANEGLYELIAYNDFGAATNSAFLRVRTKPDLRITEVMSSPASNNIPTADWWELFNAELRPINLKGWRFNDSGGGLSDPFVITNDLVIGGGETMIFVENLSETEFRAWWGSELPDNVPIFTYSGPRLSFRAEGDELNLWDDDPFADPDDTVAKVTFGAADPGVTFYFEVNNPEQSVRSQEGVNGAFRAAGGTDVGSPGRVQ